MLHEFLTANRAELVRRCTEKVALRDSPPPASRQQEHGVPLFLGQLIDTLRREEEDGTLQAADPAAASKSGAALESRRTAALHGKELLDQGYTIEQVVHAYGDVCQAMTELARETHAPVTVEEFHTFNRLMDNAIAVAVASYGRHRDESRSAQGNLDLHERMGTLAEEQRRLLDRALTALDALKIGNIGILGATGSVLEDSLTQLRDLIDRALPEIRLSTGMTAGTTTPQRP